MGAVVEEHHPDARAAFLCGSVITDRRTATSDLDTVVLLHGAPAPYRLNVHEHGWPAELLVHTGESWHDFVKREVRNLSSPHMWMCANGVLLLDRDGVGARISAHAKSLAAAGPPPTPTQEIDDRRYALDDLTGCTDPGERLFICTELARRTTELVLALHTAWNGGRKWLARRLDATTPASVSSCATVFTRRWRVTRRCSSRSWTRSCSRLEVDSGPGTGAAARGEVPVKRGHTTAGSRAG